MPVDVRGLELNADDCELNLRLRLIVQEGGLDFWLGLMAFGEFVRWDARNGNPSTR